MPVGIDHIVTDSVVHKLKDVIQDATKKTAKEAEKEGSSFFGKIGKGFVKYTGKGAYEGTKAIGSAAINSSEFVGKSVMKTAMHNPGLFIGAAVTATALSAFAADQDGQVDVNRTAAKGAVGGMLLAGIPGAAGAMTGLGVGALGAGIAGLSALGTVGKSMVKAPNKKIGLGDLSEFELNKKFAIPLVLGVSAFNGIADGVQNFEKGRMGMSDGMLRSATPMLPSPNQVMNSQPGNPTTLSNRYYANNAGATGDLVFAMHRNR